MVVLRVVDVQLYAKTGSVAVVIGLVQVVLHKVSVFSNTFTSVNGEVEFFNPTITLHSYPHSLTTMDQRAEKTHCFMVLSTVGKAFLSIH